MQITEKCLESDIEVALLSSAGSYTKGIGVYDPNYSRSIGNYHIDSAKKDMQISFSSKRRR